MCHDRCGLHGTAAGRYGCRATRLQGGGRAVAGAGAVVLTGVGAQRREQGAWMQCCNVSWPLCVHVVHGAALWTVCTAHSAQAAAELGCAMLWCVVINRTFPQHNFLEQSLRTGVQPELARQLVVPVLQTFAGGCHRQQCVLHVPHKAVLPTASVPIVVSWPCSNRCHHIGCLCSGVPRQHRQPLLCTCASDTTWYCIVERAHYITKTIQGLRRVGLCCAYPTVPSVSDLPSAFDLLCRYCRHKGHHRGGLCLWWRPWRICSGHDRLQQT